jgi:amino acid adenylation domain-containing protein
VSDFAKRIAALPPEKRALLEARLWRQGAGGPAPNTGVQDASFAQERLWSLAQLAQNTGSDHFVLTSHIPLDGVAPETLRKAVAFVIDRHEALRTEIVTQTGNKTVQIVQDPPAEPLVICQEGQDVAGAVLAVRSLTPPLFRALAVADGVTLVAHAAVCDGPSLSILRREILAACEAFGKGEAPDLPPVRLQPGESARKQRQRLSGARMDALLSPWRPLEKAPALALHTDRPRRASGLPDILHHSWTAASDLRGSSPWATVFSIVLARFARQDMVVLGAQTRRAFDFVGVATNTLPLIVDVGEDPGARTLAETVERDLQTFLALEEIPYEKLLAELKLRRTGGQNPLVQAVLAVRSELEPEDARSDAWFSGGSVLFDVALTVDDTSSPPRLELLYDGHLFDEGTVRALAGAIDAVARAVVESPEEPVSILPLMDTDAAVFDDGPMPAAPEMASTIHGLFERRAALSPALAVFKSRQQEISYADLNDRANRLARAMIERGIGKGKAVGVYMSKSADLVLAFLAVLKTGAAYLPLDPGYPPARVAFMAADTGVSLILTREDSRATVPTGFEVLDVSELDLSAFDGSDPDLDVDSHAAAYVIYTSGSTGEPKGVMVPHIGVCHVADEQVRHFALTEGERILLFSSLNFDASLFELVMAPRCGGELHLAEVEELIPGAPLVALLAARRITVLTIPPSTVAVLPPAELKDLRVLVVAGEACGAELVSRWSPGRRFFNAYGPTEGSIWATVEECTPAGQSPSIGRPLAHMRVRVVDPKLRPVPAGAPGELLLGGPGVALGYLNRPGLTAERFLRSQGLGAGDGPWYRTGDVVRMDVEGRLWYLGRNDRQMKVRGYRIEPAEIEACLLQIQGVSAAAVEVESEALVAYYTVDDPSLQDEQVQQALEYQFPEHMVPQKLVLLDAMPVNASGKLDRAALATLSRQREAGIRPPRNHTEQVLAGIWKSLLQIEDVSIDADFFSLGGHSLLAAVVMSRASEALGRELPLRTLFRSRTIATLAEAFDNVEIRASEVPAS